MDAKEILNAAVTLNINESINIENYIITKQNNIDKSEYLSYNIMSSFGYNRRKKYCVKCTAIETFEWDLKENDSLNLDIVRFSQNIKNHNNIPISVNGVSKTYVRNFSENFYFKERCTNCNERQIAYFHYNVHSHTLTKSGEFPSRDETIKIPSKYNKYLPGGNGECLAKARILREMSYTKGAIVYLRTAFEYIIDNLLANDELKKVFSKIK